MCRVSPALSPVAETNQSRGVWSQNYGPLRSPESIIKNGLVTQRDAVLRTLLPPSAEAACFIVCDHRIASPQGRHKTNFLNSFFGSPLGHRVLRLCRDHLGIKRKSCVRSFLERIRHQVRYIDKLRVHSTHAVYFLSFLVFKLFLLKTLGPQGFTFV